MKVFLIASKVPTSEVKRFKEIYVTTIYIFILEIRVIASSNQKRLFCVPYIAILLMKSNEADLEF